MDIHMPVLDGYTATQQIQAHPEWRSIPVVALTAYAMKEQQAQFQNMFDAYLSKPVSKQQLFAMLARFLPHTEQPEQEETDYLAHYEAEALAALTQAREHENILTEVQAFLNRVQILPLPCYEMLEKTLIVRHKEICGLMSIDEMSAFAEAVIEAGTDYSLPPLQNYGKELLRVIRLFDIVAVKRLLALFPKIVEMIDRHKDIEH
jgi:CheY-like chemotaxis protein